MTRREIIEAIASGTPLLRRDVEDPADRELHLHEIVRFVEEAAARRGAFPERPAGPVSGDRVFLVNDGGRWSVVSAVCHRGAAPAALYPKAYGSFAEAVAEYVGAVVPTPSRGGRARYGPVSVIADPPSRNRTPC